MGKRKFHSVAQLWYQLVYSVATWFEWQDAKCWAKEYRPAWVHFAAKCKHKETRDYYREKIIAAYKGETE